MMKRLISGEDTNSKRKNCQKSANNNISVSTRTAEHTDSVTLARLQSHTLGGVYTRYLLQYPTPHMVPL